MLCQPIKIRFAHPNYSQDDASEKLFEPHVFAWNGGSWYLKGKLLRNNEERFEEPPVQVLALHRIETAEMREGTFFPAPEILKSIKEAAQDAERHRKRNILCH